MLIRSLCAKFSCLFRTTANDDYVATECLQLHGGYGYMSECPVAQAFLDARIQSIWAGTNEIMKNIVAKSINQ